MLPQSVYLNSSALPVETEAPRVNLALSREQREWFIKTATTSLAPVTRSASHLSSFVKQISLDVSSECNSDVHSQSRGWLRWKRHPFSRLQTGVSLSLTPRLIVAQSFLMVKGCSLSCDPLTFGKIGWWRPLLKKKLSTVKIIEKLVFLF